MIFIGKNDGFKLVSLAKTWYWGMFWLTISYLRCYRFWQVLGLQKEVWGGFGYLRNNVFLMLTNDEHDEKPLVFPSVFSAECALKWTRPNHLSSSLRNTLKDFGFTYNTLRHVYVFLCQTWSSMDVHLTTLFLIPPIHIGQDMPPVRQRTQKVKSA